MNTEINTTTLSRRTERRARSIGTRPRLALLVLLAGIVSASQVQAGIPEIDWNTALSRFQVDNDKFVGQRLTFNCPELTVRDKLEEIFGTGTYPSRTPLCAAALHAGAINQDGGCVTVQLNPGAAAYSGSVSNGVTSRDFPGTERSLVFVPSAGAAPDDVQRAYAPRLKWDTKFTQTGLANRNLVGQRFAFTCPSASGNLTPRRVYGTDHYAFNSYVCQAAVHAGRITTAGGFVLVQLDEGVPRLYGSIRNGIESKDGSGGSRTLSFLVPGSLGQVSAR